MEGSSTGIGQGWVWKYRRLRKATTFADTDQGWVWKYRRLRKAMRTTMAKPGRAYEAERRSPVVTRRRSDRGDGGSNPVASVLPTTGYESPRRWLTTGYENKRAPESARARQPTRARRCTVHTMARAVALLLLASRASGLLLPAPLSVAPPAVRSERCRIAVRSSSACALRRGVPAKNLRRRYVRARRVWRLGGGKERGRL